MRKRTVIAPITTPPKALSDGIRQDVEEEAKQNTGCTNASPCFFQDTVLRSCALGPLRYSPLEAKSFQEQRLHTRAIPIPPTQTMTVTGLNHFNITASPALIERVKKFYIDVVGLTVGPRAHLDHGGYWLYAGHQPILHLSARLDIAPNNGHGKGFFNHISLSCVGLSETVSKMLATSTPYQIAELSDLGQTQIFITDPAGIGVELTFCNEGL